MPASQTTATERRNDRTVTHEPPKLKTTLKTPPKQATNPLQFVKVGPCSLYRSAQEQLQKVQEVKKIKQEVREDPEDWQSNLDNWKSSRRKRQEHIIERVVEVKKLELEEHDRQRRRSKTFSEMMEERGNRGRKLSMSLAMYHEEDSNDLSDLGIGTSSGKSSVSGDTHDDAQSVLSDRDSEIEKNHSDVDNTLTENGNDSISSLKKSTFGNGFHNNNHHNNHEYDSAATATASSPEPEEYTYEGAIRGYVSRVSQNIPRRSLVTLDAKLDNSKSNMNGSKTSLSEETNGVKVDILKRREIFEKGSPKSTDNKSNNRLGSDFPSSKTIKERLSHLEKQKSESETVDKTSSKALNRLSGDMNSIRERLSHLEKQASEREKINHHNEDLESVRPLRERLSTLEKYSSSDESTTSATPHEPRHNGELSARSIKDRLSALDAARNKELEKRNSSVKHAPLCFRDPENRVDNSTPSERSSSPDSEYRAPRAAFHRSLDSLDADASSGPDTFERVQSLEELDYTRRYPASTSSAEILNDTDREDSGIHTADVSCSVSQADEPIDEELVHSHVERQQPVIEEKPEPRILEVIEIRKEDVRKKELRKEKPTILEEMIVACQREAVTTMKDTAESSSGEESNKSLSQTLVVTNINNSPSSSRPIIYQSPKVPPRRTPPEILIPKSLAASKATDPVEKISQLSLKLDISEKSPMESSSNVFLFFDDSDSSKASSPASPPTPNFPALIPRSNINTTTCPVNCQDAKSIPCISPRTSKIPTPLPRKITKSSPTGSTSSLSSPVAAPTSPKFNTPKLRNLTKTSEIPVPIPTSPSSSSKVPFFKMEDMSSSKSLIPTSSSSSIKATQVMDSRPAERRLTVVEVCEKVVVPQGQGPPTPPVAPFITVECFKNSRTSEEPAVIEEAVEEMIYQTIKPVDREEVEATGTPLNTEIEMVSQQKTEEEPEPVIGEPEVIFLPPVSEKLERPSTLNFVENQKAMEMFCPMSQGSTPIFPLNLTSDEELVAGLSFPMGPPTSVEPPKEKPPPPPVEFSDEESQPVEPLKRLNSTRRIKKELRTRRSDFLGIGGMNDDDYEQELSLTKPPDMAAILAEERRIEQLHRRSYDTDSNYEQDSNHERDSGVELGHVEDWTKQPISPDISQHSRQSSEPFGASVTSSEEDEITKKEREIIEVLEKEEQWRYGNSCELNSDIGEKLAHKLLELEEEKMQLERERAQETEEQRRQEETMRKNEENIRQQEEILRKQQEEIERQEEAARVQEAKRLDEERKEEELRIQVQEKLKIKEIEEKEKKAAEARRQEEIQNKNLVCATQYNNQDDEFSTGDVLRVERELLQLEQEELQRKRSNLAYREQKQQQLAQQLEEQWKSLQDVANGSPRNFQQYKLQTPLNYRSSMPNLQMQDVQRRRPPPPPIPPAKPLRMVEQRQRDVTIRNSRVPSADSIPQQVDASMRHSASATMLANHGGQQMTRQTLQALSAVPRPRIVQGDQWVQRRKSDVPRGAQDYNYQHWLIQEAEQRRISEKNQRSPVRKQQHATGTSVPYTASPPRSDSKPLPDSIIQTITQRVQARAQEKPLPPRRRLEQSSSQELPQKQYVMQSQKVHQSSRVESQEKMLSVSGKKKCSHCGDELGRGAAMIIESLRLFYHMECFKCCVCHVRLGDGLMGTDVRVRNHKLHCHNCYSSDDGVKFSCV
ncbi:uncharacterized protein LOC117176113 isoform X2 [Belonocnema kinseyi]|uniref:uncharacterized protein LOC117176113 isoform X2 n=1 Tax=Belonocnema kinseyi TaxID=2817044 RepID=UPI00143CFF11|nr:uncharacterized protein LOC117176113 isoform X2 [Belonocnema kinseyi]